MKLRINSYSFGRMMVGNREFTSDLIIHQDGRIQDNWWRAQGHNLLPGDITALIDDAPEILVIGTGANGLMRISNDVSELCERHGIKIEACYTPEAVTRFNKAADVGKVVAACFHLTC